MESQNIQIAPEIIQAITREATARGLSVDEYLRQALGPPYVAVMNIHGITHLLTDNKGDFKRFTSITAFSTADA